MRKRTKRKNILGISILLTAMLAAPIAAIPALAQTSEALEAIEHGDSEDTSGTNQELGAAPEEVSIVDAQSSANVLTVGSSKDVTLADGECWVGSFVVPEYGMYVFESAGDADTYAELYTDKELEDCIADNDDGGEGLNFRIVQNLTGGTTVYLKVFNYDEETPSFSILTDIFDVNLRVEASNMELVKGVDYDYELDEDGDITNEWCFVSFSDNDKLFVTQSGVTKEYEYSGWDEWDSDEEEEVWVRGFVNVDDESDHLDWTEYTIFYDLKKRTVRLYYLGAYVDLPVQFVEDNLPTICEVYLAEHAYAYDGAEKRPKVTVYAERIDGEGSSSRFPIDSGYDITYENNKEVGTATVTVTARDGSSYTGSASAEFIIYRAGRDYAQDFGGCVWWLENDGTLVIAPNPESDGQLPSNEEWDWSFWPWYGLADGIKAIRVESGVAAGESCYMLFGSMSSARTIDVSGLDASKAKFMNGAFYDCRLVQTLDLSGWAAHVPPSLRALLQGCESLKTVNLSGWDTSNVEDIGDMFSGCHSLERLDLFGWDTSNVIGMDAPFIDCANLKFLDISSFDSSKADDGEYMDGLFLQVYDMCPSLEEIRIGSKFNVTNAGPFPVPANKSGKWWSTADKTWYTPEQIRTSRSFMADTYLSAAPVVSISGVAITGITNKTYSGKAQTQNPVVKLGSTTLKAGIDYTLSYRNNVNAGTATVTVTGKGDYVGTASATFTIAAVNISGAGISGLANKTYTGSAQTQNLVVKLGSSTLKAGTDYTVSYKNNVDAGTATVTVTGKGNYAGTKSATFAIAKAANPMKVSAVKRTAKASKVKSKKQTVAAPLKFDKKAAGKVTYARVAKGSAKCLTVNKKNGKVTVAKGTKKGTYKVKIKVAAAGNGNYGKASKTITCEVVVK